MQDLVSLMEQRLTRRAELYQKTLKLTGNQSEQTYKPKLEPIQPYQTKIEKAKVHRKNPSSTNEVPKLVIREFDTVDFAEINQKNIKKFDYLQFENKILEAKDNIRDLKNRKNLGPSRPFFSKSDIDKFLNNSAESSVSNKGMFSIDSRDSKVSFPNVLLEYSPKSPRAIEIDNKMAVKSPIKGSLKPLHQRDVEPPPPRAKPNSPVFKPYDKINLTYDRINTSYELEEDLISEVSSVKLSSVKHSRSPSFFTNFNQKLTILEPLDLKRIENLKQHQTIQTSTNDQSSRIMISSPRPPFKSPFKGYLEHKEHQKKYIKWINPLKFKQIQDELVKKNPLKNPSNSSFVLNFNTLG